MTPFHSLTSRDPSVYTRLRTRSFNVALIFMGAILASCDEAADPMGPSSPTVSIISPASGLVLSEGQGTSFVGSASDPQDGTLPEANLAWASSIDGALGTGSTVQVSSLSVGVHNVTLTATDAQGNEGQASISVSVMALDFLDGTVADPEIGVIVNSTGNAVRLFQLGAPTEFREIPLGASSAVTATGVSVRGDRAAVPLGNAASTAIIDLRTQQIESFFFFGSGNATGSDFVSDDQVLVANQQTDEVGTFSIGSGGGTITDVVPVAPFPTGITTVSGSQALVVSSNLNDSFAPIGPGVVTAIDPMTMTVTGTVETGGNNPQSGSLGPDGLFYVANTGNFVDPGSLAIIDPATMTLVDVIDGFGVGPGGVHVDASGLVYVSGFFFGTLVWDSNTQAFVRGPADPICAPLSGGGCRGAFSAFAASDGTLYQTFFGSSSQGLSPWVFKYSAQSFALADSIASGIGPVEVEVHSFRR